jgi:cold-inducible RNA-binding protein
LKTIEDEIGACGMARKLHIGNVTDETTDAQIQQLFSEAGEVISVEIQRDNTTGKPRGFAFVLMATERGAADAILRFHAYRLNNRDITVSDARIQGSSEQAQ